MKIYSEEKIKGITLINLMITIVLLLILSGIAIASFTHEHGIIDKVDLAQEKWNSESENESVFYNIMNEPVIAKSNFWKSYRAYDLSPIQSGQKFTLATENYNAGNQTFFADIDISSIAEGKKLENLISIGEDIGIYTSSVSNKLNLHFFYPNDDGKLVLSATMKKAGTTQMQLACDLFPNETNIKIACNRHGVYINGAKIIDEEKHTVYGALFSGNRSDMEAFFGDYFNRLESGIMNVQIGSTEGTSRSTATYNDVGIFDELLSEKQMLELTKTEMSTTFREDDIDISTIRQGQPFRIFDGSISMLHETFYIEIDVANIDRSKKLQNLISIGNQIEKWGTDDSNGVNVHLYYPTENEEYILGIIKGGTMVQVIHDVDLRDNKFKIAVSSHGLFINGEKILGTEGVKPAENFVLSKSESATPETIAAKQATFVNLNNHIFANYRWKTNNLQIGSQEGQTRSTATYNRIVKITGVMTEAETLELTR